MKKQINSASIWSMKTSISLTVLITLFGATEVNAKNYDSAEFSKASKEVKVENSEENVNNKNLAPWVVNNDEAIVDEEIIDVIAQWIVDGSYWSPDDSIVNKQIFSVNLDKSEWNQNRAKALPIQNKPFVFNAESYIPQSEF
jgi:hypothetical protein